MKIDFEHKQSAHCENGATSNLMNFYGIKLSEPMTFGIASGLFFSYMPFVKLNGLPVVSFRPWPGMIFKRVTGRLKVGIKYNKFSNKQDAMNKLDELLENSIPTGLLVGVYNLSYFPQEYRFHFNAHNIVVIGKEDNNYIISDPVMENIETLTYNELEKVRFAQGTYPPKGRLYYVTDVPNEPSLQTSIVDAKVVKSIDLSQAILKGIKKNCNDMLSIPIPLFGVKGIKYLAKRVKNWDRKLGEKKASLYLGQVIRMLEEIGTGGAGFRFIYAAFLQEAAGILNKAELLEQSKQMTLAGDKWREFASLAAKNLNARRKEKTSYGLLSEILLEIAVMEEDIFRKLLIIVNKI